MSDRGAEADARRERRRWIRQHHPDRGGSAEDFDVGLRRLDPSTTPVSEEAERPTVVRTFSVRRRARTLGRCLRALRRRSRRTRRVR